MTSATTSRLRSLTASSRVRQKHVPCERDAHANLPIESPKARLGALVGVQSLDWLHRQNIRLSESRKENLPDTAVQLYRADLKKILKYELFHLGGDEVNTGKCTETGTYENVRALKSETVLGHCRPGSPFYYLNGALLSWLGRSALGAWSLRPRHGWMSDAGLGCRISKRRMVGCGKSARSDESPPSCNVCQPFVGNRKCRNECAPTNNVAVVAFPVARK